MNLCGLATDRWRLYHGRRIGSRFAFGLLSSASIFTWNVPAGSGCSFLRKPFDLLLPLRACVPLTASIPVWLCSSKCYYEQ